MGFGPTVPTMPSVPSTNTLYLAVLPLIHLSNVPYIGGGLTEEVLTLVADPHQATQFFRDEVDGYISMFQNRAKYLTGGHITGYESVRVPLDNGRFAVRVLQHVTD